MAVTIAVGARAETQILPVDPAPDESGIVVSLVVKRPLRLVRVGSELSLEGELDAVLTNRGPSSLRLVVKHDVHGVVFTPVGGGKPFIVVHSCQCVESAQSGKWEAYGLFRDKPRIVRLDAWGCGGGPFRTPPPGRYVVTYRTLVYRDPLPPSPTPSDESVKELVRRCTLELKSEAYWKGAIVSNPVDVSLVAP